MSFRRRVAFTAAAAVAIAVAVGSVAAYLVVRDTLLGQIDTSLRNAAQQTSLTATSATRTSTACTCASTRPSSRPAW